MRDIKKEKAKELDNVRFLVLVSLFLQYFLLLQQQEQTRNIKHTSEEGHDFDLVAEVTELACLDYVLARIRLSLDEKVDNKICFERSQLTFFAAAELGRTARCNRLLHSNGQ